MKRGITGQDQIANKRMALESSTDSTTNLQSGEGGKEELPLIDTDFVENFQKEAIWREMNVYKRRLEQSEARLNELTTERGKVEAKSAWLVRWVQQVAETFNCIEDNKSDQIPESDSSRESPFLLNESEIGLGELLFDTRKRVTRLIEKLEKSIPDLKFSADGEERLRTKYLKLTDRVFALEQLAQSSKNKADEIQRHREELEERLIYMERQVERARSKYGKIIEGTPSAAAEEKNVIAQGSDASAGVSADLKSELDDLKEKYEFAMELSDRRKNEILELSQELSKIRQDFDQTKIDICTLPEHIIMDTGICKQLRRQVEFSQSETRILREQIDQTIQELESVKMERQLLFDQIDSESQEKLKALESEIQKLSGDLNRIRTGRDQLQQQLELEKAKRKQHDDLNQELKLNAKANKDRIVCLLEEIKRIKSRFAAFSGDRELFRDVLLACDLPIEEMENEKAILGHKSLIQSLRDRLAATEQTVQSLRDCLEASELSADQKNAQEAILREKALIRRVDELQLRIKQNEAIFGSVEQHSDQSTESSSLAVEAVKKQKEIDELKLKIEHFELAEKSTVSEIEMISQSFTNLESKQSNQTKLLEEKEDQIARLLAERIKHDQRLISMQKEKDSHSNKAIALSRQSQKQADLIRKLEEDVASKSTLLSGLERELVQGKTLVALHERKAQDALELAEELSLKIEKTGTKYSEISALIKERDKEIGDLQMKIHNLDEENRKLQQKIKHLGRRLQTVSSTTGASGGVDCNDELEALRDWKKIAQCSVCEFRIKNQVITRCMHVFCKECIDKRLDTRQRKCPQCGIMFGPGDVKQIFI